MSELREDDNRNTNPAVYAPLVQPGVVPPSLTPEGDLSDDPLAGKEESERD